MTDTDSPRHAATILVLRDGSEGPEVFMVKRHRGSSFMASVHVYPGGALDPEDCTPDAEEIITGLTADDAHAILKDDTITPAQALGLYLAGVRETFEEAGILLASRPDEDRWVDLTSDPDVARRFDAHRVALRAGDISLTHVMHDEGLIVPLGALAYFARWITPYMESKRFDARFFITHAPEHQTPLHDDEETVDSAWMRPEDALRMYREGAIDLAPPTLSTLMRLVGHGPVEAIMEQARTYTPPTILPHGAYIDDTMVLMFPGDPDYPAQKPRYATGRGEAPYPRMILRDGTWVVP